MTKFYYWKNLLQQKVLQKITTKETLPTKTISTSVNKNTISLLIIINIYCYFIKNWSKQKHLLKENHIRNCTCNCFADMINIKNLDLSKIKRKSYKNILIYHIWYHIYLRNVLLSNITFYQWRNQYTFSLIILVSSRLGCWSIINNKKYSCNLWYYLRLYIIILKHT